ncbi:hypothetical protein F2Q68_00035573 [Brassica cretica]|uniref:Uncharacterized protein n=1 Tax=Brassica cretica TaxID=69181 RepID=A0A8S9HAZ9_BRACR|nr:hypothetical protein F2Q68_00035573 [Brassica cretica]
MAEFASIDNSNKRFELRRSGLEDRPSGGEGGREVIEKTVVQKRSKIRLCGAEGETDGIDESWRRLEKTSPVTMTKPTEKLVVGTNGRTPGVHSSDDAIAELDCSKCQKTAF